MLFRRGVKVCGLLSLILSFESLTLSQDLVAILVEQSLFNELGGELIEYQADLELQGYLVSTISGSWSSPTEVRSLLQSELPNGLVGAVLVGDIPMARFNLPENVGDSYWHDFYAGLFYMDLDGNWGGVIDGVYTDHTGDLLAEIWVGIVRADNLSVAGNEVDLLRRYFAKIHNYRSGMHYRPPFRACQQYFTLEPSYANLAAIYPDVTNMGCNGVASNLKSFLQDPRGYDFAVINTASGYNVHHFHAFSGWPVPAEEWVTDHGPDDVDYRDVHEANPKILFYHLATSETGRFDQRDFLGGHYVFGNDYGLVALASTQHSIVGDNFYEPLAGGMSFGEAFKAEMNSVLSRYQQGGRGSPLWCEGRGGGSSDEPLTRRFYSAILLGDPTLRISRPPAISNVAVAAITATSAMITWVTDEASDSQVEYGLDTSYGSTTALDSLLVTIHTVVLSDLLANTTYHYRVKSRDAEGNLAASGDSTFTTAADVPVWVNSHVSRGGVTETLAIANYPNPFNANTRIRLSLNVPAEIRGVIVNASGREVRALYAGELAAGIHEIIWQGDDNTGRPVASGVYFVRLLYRLQTEGQWQRHGHDVALVR